MKAFYLVTIFFCAFALINCDDDSSEELFDQLHLDYLKHFVKVDKGEVVNKTTSKIEEICPGATEKLKAALVSFEACDNKTDDSLSVCEQIQRYTLNCSKPVLDVIDGCLPAHSKGLTNLGLKSLVSVADYLCKQHGEQIFELLNPCLYEDDDNESPECSEEKIVEKTKKWGEEIPSPSEICGFATGLRTCVETSNKKTCKSPKTRAAALGLFDAFVAPCSSINEIK